MVKVKLTLNEMIIGSIVGARRRIDAIYKGIYREGWNKDRIGWNMDLEAALAELAVAKVLNKYWDFSVNTFKVPDVDRYQVRHTDNPNGKLIIRENDKNDEVFFLVIGISPEYSIAGWLKAIDAKVDKYRFNGYGGVPDCWMVPKEELKEIEKMREG